MPLPRRKKNLLINNPPPPTLAAGSLLDAASLKASPEGVFNQRSVKPATTPLPSGAAPASAVLKDAATRKHRKARQNRSFQDDDDRR